MPLEHNHVDDSEYITTPTTPEEETPTETSTESSDDINQDIIDTEKIWDEYERDEYDAINTKEDIKYLMDKSKNSQELYENAIKVLTNLESNFVSTLWSVAHDENWNWDKQSWINRSVFDDELDTDNPVTLFEKKWKELLQKAKTVQENLKVQNAASQTVWETDLSWINENEKNQLIEELFKTRTEAIQDFKNDISDGFLSNENNISREKFREAWEIAGEDLFKLKEKNIKEFEENISKMDLPQLAFSTFNIDQWSWAFTYCYWKLKEKLWNKNLFDFIDEQEKLWGLTWDGIKYSAFKMLFQRRMTSDLTQMMDGYSWNKDELVKYVENNIKENERFKMSFLTSIKDVESSKYFWDIAKDLKENDPDVKKAYEATSNIDNIDIFKDKKVNGLMLYDDEWHWGWATYFDSDFKDYQKKGFTMVSKDENNNYKKYVLKKGNDTINMVKLKVDENKNLNLEEVLQSITDGQDYNLFALRWHCYNTGDFADTLWEIGAVWEGDLLIDGWCNNAWRTRDYYNSWVKGQICAYTATGKWASTQAFIDRIISAKNSWKSFSDVLWYYNSLTSDSGRDGYFAFSTERPDSVSAQYKKLRHNQDDEWLEEDSNTTVRDEAEAQSDVPPSVDVETQGGNI